MHQIVVTIFCRLRPPPFSLKGMGPFQAPENRPFLWEVLLLLQDLPPPGKLGAEGDTKWWTSA